MNSLNKLKIIYKKLRLCYRSVIKMKHNKRENNVSKNLNKWKNRRNNSVNSLTKCLIVKERKLWRNRIMEV